MVYRNGSCVMMIANSSAGSSGARRAIRERKVSPPRGARAGAARKVVGCAGGGAVVAVLAGGLLPLVDLADRLGVLLPLGQRRGHRTRPGEHVIDVAAHLVTEVGELGHVDELDADRRPLLHTWVGRVGVLDRLLDQLVVRGRRLL